MKNHYPMITRLDLDKLDVTKGQAKAIHHSETEKPFYQWTRGARDYETAMQERIAMPMEHGMLIVRREDGSIKFDDRKLRFSGITESNGRYTLAIGPTHFGEIQSIDIPATQNPTFECELRQEGLALYGDQDAFFGKTFGVGAIPITNEGHIHFFKRADNSEIYPGFWHFLGGHVDTNYQFLEKGNASEVFRNMIKHTSKKELVEEGKVGKCKIYPVAMYSHYTAEFSLATRVPLSGEEFLKRQLGAEHASDHSKVQTLRNLEEVTNFLSNARIITSSKDALERITRGEVDFSQNPL